MHPTLDSSDNLYVGDYLDFRVEKIDTSGAMTVVAGSSSSGGTPVLGQTAATQPLGRVTGSALDGSTLCITDNDNGALHKVASETITQVTVGGGLNSVTDVDVDSNHNVHIADWGGHVAKEVTPAV